MEEEYVANQERLKPQEERNEEDRSKVDDLRGSPLSVGTLEELIDEKYVDCFYQIVPVYVSNVNVGFFSTFVVMPLCPPLLDQNITLGSCRLLIVLN